MKSILWKLYYLILLLINVETFAQNNLFEKVYQKGFTEFEYKFLKRDSSGFAVYTENVGVNNNPFSSYNCIHHCNDTGLIVQQTEINLVPEFWERFEILDWHNTADGNFIVNYAGNGCDYSMFDSCLIFKMNSAGSLLWHKKGLPTEFYSDESGLIKYLNGYLNYWIPSTTSSTQNIKFLFCGENGNTRPLAQIANNNYIELFSNGASLFALQQIAGGNTSIAHIDTLGNIYQNYAMVNGGFSNHKRAFAFHQNKIVVSYNNTLHLLTDSLVLIQQINLSNAIIKLQIDTTGNIWALLENGDLMAFDSTLTTISTTNLLTSSGNINSVNWFEIDVAKDRIYFGGLAASKPFLKSMELGTFNHFENSIAIKVTSTQISNASGNLSFLHPTAPVYGLAYQFNVDATIKNIGNTVIDKVVLNCSPPLGYYVCNLPYLSTPYNNLNLMPGDSVSLFVGIYGDYNVHIPIANPMGPYTRQNFCVWPSAPNDSWSHNALQFHCQDIEITSLIGVHVNNLEDLSSVIQLLPNPSIDRMLVTIPENFSPSEISIVDLTGSTVLKYYNEETLKISIDVSQLSNGIYFLQLSDGEKMARKKFVKLNE